MESFMPQAGTSDIPGGSTTSQDNSWDTLLRRTAGEIIDIVQQRGPEGVAPGTGYGYAGAATQDNGEAVLLVIAVVLVILMATSK